MEVKWREYFNTETAKELEEMGTLPIEITNIDDTTIAVWGGEEVAAYIAEDINPSDPERFCNGGTIVILEPAHFAGIYYIDVQYEPIFSASLCDDPEHN